MLLQLDTEGPLKGPCVKCVVPARVFIGGCETFRRWSLAACLWVTGSVHQGCNETQDPLLSPFLFPIFFKFFYMYVCVASVLCVSLSAPCV